MPAKKLTPDQKADAARLKSAFKAWQKYQKAKGLPHSQEEITDGLGFGQSALSQYLNGHIPLNGVALQKLCALMEINPRSISPAIVEAEILRARQWIPAQEAKVIKHPAEDVSKAGLRKLPTQKDGRKAKTRLG